MEAEKNVRRRLIKEKEGTYRDGWSTVDMCVKKWLRNKTQPDFLVFFGIEYGKKLRIIHTKLQWIKDYLGNFENLSHFPLFPKILSNLKFC